MDEMRKAFEAWATAAPREWGARRYMSSEMPWPGEYQEYRVQCAWEAWQDACAAEREACAQVCEAYALRTSGYLDNDMTAVKFADAIRARSQQ